MIRGRRGAVTAMCRWIGTSELRSDLSAPLRGTIAGSTRVQAQQTRLLEFNKVGGDIPTVYFIPL